MFPEKRKLFPLRILQISLPLPQRSPELGVSNLVRALGERRKRARGEKKQERAGRGPEAWGRGKMMEGSDLESHGRLQRDLLRSGPRLGIKIAVM